MRSSIESKTRGVVVGGAQTLESHPKPNADAEGEKVTEKRWFAGLGQTE